MVILDSTFITPTTLLFPNLDHSRMILSEGFLLSRIGVSLPFLNGKDVSITILEYLPSPEFIPTSFIR